MIVYNLTDHSLPYRQARKPKKLKLVGKLIEPGGSADIPDHLVQIADIAGWLTSNEVSIDGLPEWYQEARRKEKDATSVKAEVVPDKKKSPKKKKRKKAEED